MSKIKVKETKDLGWAHISVTSTTYKGGVQNYTGTGDSIAIVFGVNQAFIIEDDQGVYFEKDYTQLVKSGNASIFTPTDIEGASVLAFVEDGAVLLNDEELDRLNINTLEVRQDIMRKLLHLSTFEEAMEV